MYPAYMFLLLETKFTKHVRDQNNRSFETKPKYPRPIKSISDINLTNILY